MGKAEETKTAIIEVAVQIAARLGVEGLTLGTLAEATDMSKSGLYARFGSAEELQLAVLEAGREQFERDVLRPALKQPRGEPRARALFESWRALSASGAAGCLFVSAASEYDDRPGNVRERLVEHHSTFGASLQRLYVEGVQAGAFRQDFSAAQFAFDLHGILLVHFYATRLLEIGSSDALAAASFERLLETVRAPK